MSSTTKEPWQVIPITKQMGQTTNVIVQTDTTSASGKSTEAISQNSNQITENQKFDTVNQMDVKPLGGGSKERVEYKVTFKEKEWMYKMNKKMGSEKEMEESIVKDFMNKKKNIKTEYMLKLTNVKKEKDSFYIVRQTQKNRIRKLYD